MIWNSTCSAHTNLYIICPGWRISVHGFFWLRLFQLVMQRICTYTLEESIRDILVAPPRVFFLSQVCLRLFHPWHQYNFLFFPQAISLNTVHIHTLIYWSCWTNLMVQLLWVFKHQNLLIFGCDLEALVHQQIQEMDGVVGQITRHWLLIWYNIPVLLS